MSLIDRLSSLNPKPEPIADGDFATRAPASLADRVAKAMPLSAEPLLQESKGPSTRVRRNGADQHAQLKRQVHARLLEKLGPQLYDAKLGESELAQKVRAKNPRSSWCGSGSIRTTPASVAGMKRMRDVSVRA